MTERNEHHAFKADEIPCQEISDPAVLSKNPVVSVKMITYNHEPYIAQAIEGVLMQKTDFPIELIIGEDCSTDRTREIVLDYQRKHLEIIRVIMSDHNVGANKNSLRTKKACRGKYIAFCEGDDYWHHPQKLQKQVHFLESNEEYSVCFHYVDVINNKGKVIRKHDTLTKNIYEQKDIFVSNKTETRTCSLVCRRNCLPDPMPDFIMKVFAGDKFIKMLLLEDGYKGYVIKECMAFYRKHEGGIWSLQPPEKLKSMADHDLGIMIDAFGKKFPQLVPYLKTKQKFGSIFTYLKDGNLETAWKVYLNIFRYPQIVIKNKIKVCLSFCTLVAKSMMKVVLLASKRSSMKQ